MARAKSFSPARGTALARVFGCVNARHRKNGLARRRPTGYIDRGLMKTVFKFPIVMTVALAVVGFGMLWPRAAAAQASPTVASLLSAYFHGSERVGYVRLRFDERAVHVVLPSGEEVATRPRALVDRSIQEALPRREYVVYVARTHGRVDGYMIVDSELGQHEPIDFATFLDARGVVTHVEVLAYREPYGDGVRSDRFRNQFRGRSADSGFRLGQDVDVISGASISSRSMTFGVQRAAALVSALVPMSGALASR